MSYTVNGPKSLASPDGAHTPAGTPKPPYRRIDKNKKPGKPGKPDTTPEHLQKKKPGQPNTPEQLDSPNPSMRPEIRNVTHQTDQAQKVLDRAKEKLEKQKKIQKTVLDSQKTALHNIIRATAYKVAAPEEPADLNQDDIRQVLQDMRLWNLTEKSKGTIVETVTENNKTDQKSLYKILIRRDSGVTPDIVDKIDRESKNLVKFEWTSKGMVFYIWGDPYPIPEEEKVERTPGMS